MKNISITKRFLALALAVSMGAPVLASAENNPERGKYDYSGYVLVAQEENHYQMTMEDFAMGVNRVMDYLKKFINYDHMQQDVQCLFFLTNIEYIPTELREELCSKGIIFDYNIDNEEGLKNFMNAFNLINMIADFNQSTIRENNKEIIDVSVFCFDSHDQRLVSDMNNNYFMAYKNGKYQNAYFEKVFKQLTTLNAYEQEGNAYELSTGARWLTENSIGGGVMQLLRDDMQERFTANELYKYFVRSDLNRGQWFLRDDIEFDLNCLSDQELEVFRFGQLWQFVYTDVNNDLFKYFEFNGHKYCK